MEFTLAEIAAVDWIGGVVRIVQLMGLDHLMTDAHLRCLHSSIFQIFGH